MIFHLCTDCPYTLASAPTGPANDAKEVLAFEGAVDHLKGEAPAQPEASTVATGWIVGNPGTGPD
jgi:hypothetical protein